MANGSTNLEELMFGNITIYLDFEYSTIVKLMIGLIIVMVVSAVLAKKIMK